MPPRVVKVPNRSSPAPPTPAREIPQPSSEEKKSGKAKKVTSATSSVLAAKDVDAHLKSIADTEAEDAQRGREHVDQRVLGGDIQWRTYLTPSDLTDIAQCMEIDKYNRDVFESNNANLGRVNELQRSLGLNKITITAPTRYAPIARNKYEEMLKDENFCIMSAIFFLAKRDILPERDYAQTDIQSLPGRAADIAFTEECRRKIDEGGELGVDITSTVGRLHQKHCTCENRWDGSSERCIGEGVRVRWRRGKTHHFLRPVAIPETF